LEAILFDLDGTLRHNRPDSTEALLDYAINLGLEDSPGKRRSAYQWAHYYWAQSKELLLDKQEYSELNDLFWKNYVVRNLIAFECQPDCATELAPDIFQYMSEEHQPDDWVPADVPLTLQALKQSGYRLGLLSNRSIPCDDYLEQLGLKEYFDITVVAGEVTSWKPDPKIFYHVLENLKTGAENAVYVGDNYYADIVGALNAGIQPILMDPKDVFPDVECPVITSISELNYFLD
jgi:FMN phosphatase YigB (HAD superfamily)